MNKETFQFLDDYVYAVHDFLDKHECLAFIQLAESIGFEGVGRERVRNNLRAVRTNIDIAESLWKRAMSWVVSPFGNSVAVGLNEKLRFYKYDPGQKFCPHTDGGYQRLDGDESQFTFLIYLNDDFVGGETKFFQPEPFSVIPRAGSLLLFYHHQVHEGAAVVSGTKYVLRSDVMYRRNAAVVSG